MTEPDFEESPEPTGHIQQSRSIDAGRPLGRYLMQVMWPAFLGAAAATGVFFSAVDPLQVDLVGIHLDDDRLATYTLGFLMFWVLFSLSGSLTYYLASTEHRD